MLGHLLTLARGAVHHLASAQLRSPKWRAFERAWLEEHPTCIACGGKRLLQVHHCIPFEHEPSLELDVHNVETLCMGRGCHLLIGHGDCFRDYFPRVREICRQVRVGYLTLEEAAETAKAERVPIRMGA